MKEAALFEIAGNDWRNTMDLRSSLFAKGVPKVELLTIPDVGVVEVRGLTAGARGRLMLSATVVDEDDNRHVDPVKLGPALMIACIYDATTHLPLFTEADRDALLEMDADFQDKMIEPAARLSGLGKGATKVLEKNFATTMSASPSSILPENSAV